MSHYSYQDARELAPYLECQDFDTTTDGMVDSLGRDAEDFARDCVGGLFNDYDDALFRPVDSRERVSTQTSSAVAHSVSACEFQRAMFDDAVTRYLRTHVDGAYLGHNNGRAV